MKFFYTIFLFFLFTSIHLYAQEISGIVSDSLLNKPLFNVNIYIPEIKKGTSTDVFGKFKIEVPEKKIFTVIVSYVGFKTVKLSINLKENEVQGLIIKLIHETKKISQVLVTATRTTRDIKDIPASITVYKKEDIVNMPVNAPDDILRTDASMYIDRKNGIFSKNSSVTMRGINSTSRTLILLDGVPLNKADGGGVNWNRINMESIEKIEIVKGPGSALYGGNAMAGVVNVITGKMSDTLSGTFRLSIGSCNTFGSKLWIGGKLKESKKIYWNINTFYRQGDGYIIVPDSSRNSTDVKTYLKEYNFGGKVGYAFNDTNKIEAGYNFYDDKRGDGIKVYDPEGGYNRYNTNHAFIRYSGNIGSVKIETNSYIQFENYLNQKEQLKTEKFPPYAITQYVLYLVNSHRNDIGLWCAATKNIIKNHKFTIGADYRIGSVNSSDIYYTSTDIVTTKGNLNFYAIFLQDEFNVFNDRFKFIIGIRNDAVYFNNAEFNISAPTVTSSIITPYIGKYKDTLWWAVSPKFAVQYSLNKNNKIFFNYSRGFRQGTLDDMCRNGNISKGIKLANPNLKPEFLDNFEVGTTLNFQNKFQLESSVYYSLGSDFQYFVGTGDTIFESTKPKPILKRENISKVEIIGTELNIHLIPLENLIFTVSYSYNHSIITSFDTIKFVAKNLTGKYLMEVPKQRFAATALWRNKFVNTMLVCSYTDKMFADDENTISNPMYLTFDVKFSRIIKEKYFASAGIQNISDETYIDSKGNLGIGRFFMFEMGYKF